MGGRKLTDTALQSPSSDAADPRTPRYRVDGTMVLLGSAVVVIRMRRRFCHRDRDRTSANCVAGTPAVTMRGLAGLKPSTKLTRLNLQGCKRLKDDAVSVLADSPQLQSARRQKDSGLSEAAVAKRRAASPGCRILDPSRSTRAKTLTGIAGGVVPAGASASSITGNHRRDKPHTFLSIRPAPSARSGIFCLLFVLRVLLHRATVRRRTSPPPPAITSAPAPVVTRAIR